MWFSLISLVLGAVPAVVRELAQARVAQANATTDQEKIAAEENIKALEARRDVLIQGTKSPWDIAARAFLMAPAGILMWKIWVWDKVLDLGSTDPLSQLDITLIFTIYGFYFVTKLLRR